MKNLRIRRVSIVCVVLLTGISLYAQKPKSYKFNKGDKFRVTVEITQNIKQNILGEDYATRQDISSTDDYEVVEVSSEGFTLKTTGIWRKMKSSGPGSNFELDSNVAGEENLMFKVMTGKTYYISMDRYGEVLGITGLEGIVAEMKKELAGTDLEESADEILAAYNEEDLTNSFEGQFYIYNTPGTPWGRKLDQQVNGMPVKLDMDFKWEGNSTIVGEGTMNMSGDMEALGGSITANMSGTQSSRFEVDSSSGLATKIQTIQEMEGTLEMDVGSIPMSFKTEINVTIAR